MSVELPELSLRHRLTCRVVDHLIHGVACVMN